MRRSRDELERVNERTARHGPDHGLRTRIEACQDAARAATGARFVSAILDIVGALVVVLDREGRIVS